MTYLNNLPGDIEIDGRNAFLTITRNEKWQVSYVMEDRFDAGTIITITADKDLEEAAKKMRKWLNGILGGK